MTTAATAAITTLDRRALEAIQLRRGFRRSELTPTEKRTATRLAKRGLVERNEGWLVLTAQGRRTIGLPGDLGGSLAESADD